MKIILLNGPPRCGKDTAVSILCDLYGDTYTIRWERFSRPHKEAFAAMAREYIDDRFNVTQYEHRKDEVIPWLGVSYRQWQIDFSEKFMKPLYGEDIFSRMLIERIRHRIAVERYLCIISDCGFQTEVDALTARWRRNDLMLIRILRDGCSFKGDSRNYVFAHKGIYEAEILNSGTKEDLRETLLSATKEFMQ